MAPIEYKAAQVNTNLWDPRKVLKIYHNGNQTLSCVGTASTHWNSRCRWQFFSDASPAIIAGLDALATCDPRAVTVKQLQSLAKLCLCPDNHRYQASEKGREWQVKIAQYLDEHDRIAALVVNVDRLQRLLQDALDEGKKLERRRNNDMIVAQAAFSSKSEKLNRQLSWLKGVQADFEMYKISKAAEIGALVTQLQASRKHVEEANIADENRSREIDDLKDQLEQSNAQAKTAKQASETEIGRLKAELATSNALLHTEQTKASSSISVYQICLEDYKGYLNQQEKTSSQEIESLNEQLRDSNNQLDTLKTANLKTSVDLDHLRHALQDLSKKHADSQTKSNSQITDLQQQKHNLRVQAHFNVFRTQVQLVIKQKQVEQAERANTALVKQIGRLVEQIGDIDGQLAEQSRTLSSFKLRKATRGICAVVALRPLTFSIKRTSKVGVVNAHKQAL